eukprot:GFUD01137806.1.p1 GENE.GFUD01137806.1~~GFUD01137806.1.p1  ORF type:complete len:506 (+),score=97.69 GFUD01137806.1:88-1605(+)
MAAPVAPDGGFWGWMAVVACFMGNVIGDGVMYSFGIFLPKFKEYFQCGSGEVSTINSIQMGVTFASGPIASYMTNRLGWRLTTVIGSVLASAGLCLSAVAPSVFFLYFSAGGLLGLGLGIIYLPRLDCITQYFDKKRPFVTGIAICGSGIGTFIMAPLTDVLLNMYDWKICLVILGGICFTNCFFGLMFQPLPKSQDEDSIGCEKMGDTNSETLLKGGAEPETAKETFGEMFHLLRDWAFMLFAVSNFLTSLGYPIPYTFVPDNAIHLGLTERQGSYLVGLIGISNTIARVVLGALSQKLNRLFLYNTCLVICGITMAVSNFFQPMMAAIFSVDCTLAVANATLIPALNSSAVTVIEPVISNTTSWACDPYVGQLIYVNCYGVTSAAYVLLTTLVLADLLGADKFTNSFGLLLLFQGVATFIGPPVVGFMFDAFGSYNEGFLLMGIMIALSGLMLYPIPCIKNMLTKGRIPVSSRDPERESDRDSERDIEGEVEGEHSDEERLNV